MAAQDAFGSGDPAPFALVLRFGGPSPGGSAAGGSETVGQGELAAVLDVLSRRPGFTGGWVGRAADDVTHRVLVVHWRSVGDCRRALSSVDVRMTAMPVLSRALDEPSAYEVLHGLAGEGSGSPPWGADGPSGSARASS
jgi:hypothetical protein